MQYGPATTRVRRFNPARVMDLSPFGFPKRREAVIAAQVEIGIEGAKRIGGKKDQTLTAALTGDQRLPALPVEIVAAQPASPGKPGRPPDSLTYSYSARRPFEVAYWKAIASLAEGKFLNKNNADCVLDEATQRMLPYRERHLDRLADVLLAYYQKRIAAAKMSGKALAGEPVTGGAGRSDIGSKLRTHPTAWQYLRGRRRGVR